MCKRAAEELVCYPYLLLEGSAYLVASEALSLKSHLKNKHLSLVMFKMIYGISIPLEIMYVFPRKIFINFASF